METKEEESSTPPTLLSSSAASSPPLLLLLDSTWTAKELAEYSMLMLLSAAAAVFSGVLRSIGREVSTHTVGRRIPMITPASTRRGYMRMKKMKRTKGRRASMVGW